MENYNSYNPYIGLGQMGYRGYPNFENQIYNNNKAPEVEKSEDRNIKNEEIISQEEAVQQIRMQERQEKENQLFYDSMIRNAPKKKKKKVLREIKEDGRKHIKILNDLYNKFTNRRLNTEEIKSLPEEKAKLSYREQLLRGLNNQLDDVVTNRRILGAMPDNESYTLMMSIMTDNLKNASRFNYLIHRAH